MLVTSSGVLTLKPLVNALAIDPGKSCSFMICLDQLIHLFESILMFLDEV